MIHFCKALTVALLLFGFTSLVSARPARAANAVVGNGNPASCTETALDSAIVTASNGGGVITFNCGQATKTITLTTAKIVNLGNITIDGGRRIILVAGANERHFFAGSGVTFRLRNITLRQGDALVSGGAVEASGAQVFLENVQLLDNRSSVSGGAIYCFDGALTILNSRLAGNRAGTGGAIFNDSCTVVIQNTSFEDNQAVDAIGRGGAIENAPGGALTVRGSQFSANQALDGGALFVAAAAAAELDGVSFAGNSGGHGGGIENSGALTLTNSLLDGNSVTGSGGGLWNLGGTALVRRTIITGNTAGEGGGVNTYGAALVLHDVNLTGNIANSSHGGGLYHGGGTVFVTNATFSGNQANAAGGNGGGIHQSADDNLTLTNVTLANNQANQFGGGFYHFGRYAILNYVTIGDNTAGAAGSAIYEDSPMSGANPGVVQIANSVIFGAANNCDGGLFQSLGHNISKGSCAALNAATDQENIAGNLRLGALKYNGGAAAMLTMLPQVNSPLIDAAGDCTGNPQDQRGIPRPYGAACDVGAVEYTPQMPGVYLPLVER